MFKYLILGLLSLSVNAASDFVKGEGRFYASSSDSLTFIKAQVIHKGFLDVISKELETMGLSKEVFWKKIDEKFESSFASVEAGLKNKYSIDSKDGKADRAGYNKDLRSKKLVAKKNFANLKRVIQSYSIKRYTRSQQDPNARYVKLQAKVNKTLLREIYYAYTRGKKSSDYGSLFLDVEYNLVDADYTDLGVEQREDFTSVVNDNWLKWFSENKPGNIANIQILSQDKKEKLDEYFKLPYEQMITDIPEMFVNSLYLKIEIVIEKVSSNPKLKEYSYIFSGGGYLLDLQSNNIISSMTFDKEEKKYRKLSFDKLSTVLANYVYRMPFGNFEKLKRKIKTIPPINSIHRISLFDFSNMDAVDEFLELLKGRGIKYSLNARLESIGTNRAEIVVFMDGEMSDLKTLLTELQAAKSDLKFDFIDTDNTLGVKFIKAQPTKK
jgi:hypothetical protein